MKITSILISLILIESSFAQGMAPRDWGLIVVDFNGDGIVDSADVCLMIDHWRTDEPFYDIGPMPWGDGVVDVQDLIVLANHLFENFPPVISGE